MAKRALKHVDVPAESRRGMVERGTHAIVAGKFVDVSDWSLADKLAHAKRPQAGAPLDGELKVIPCASPTHDLRAGSSDGLEHSDSLGTYTGVVPPVTFCNRCAPHEFAARAQAREAKRAQLRAAFRVDDAALDLLLQAAREG